MMSNLFWIGVGFALGSSAIAFVIGACIIIAKLYGSLFHG